MLLIVDTTKAPVKCRSLESAGVVDSVSDDGVAALVVD